MPTATIAARPDGQVKIAAAIGTGLQDAAFQAIERSSTQATLVEYRVAAVTEH